MFGEKGGVAPRRDTFREINTQGPTPTGALPSFAIRINLTLKEICKISQKKFLGESSTSGGLFDSGSNFNLSGCREDFSQVQPTATVKIVAVDGDVDGGRAVGHLGKFHPNNLGLTYGVLFPALGQGQRIISGYSLVNCGWEAILNCNSTSRIVSANETLPVVWASDELPYVQLEFHLTPKNSSITACKVKRRINVEKLTSEQALALHRAAGHMYVPGVSVQCEDCLATKGGRTGHAQHRDAGHVPEQPLQQLNLDFYGKLTPSFDNNVFCLVIICDISSFVWIYPIKTKDAVVDTVRKLICDLRASDGVNLADKVVKVVRCDNEPVLRSESYRSMLSGLAVHEAHSTPYAPSQNGVVERFMRTLGENLRANMRGVDPRLWDHCARYLSFVWNRIPKIKYARAPHFNGLAPIDAKNSRKKALGGEIWAKDDTRKFIGDEHSFAFENPDKQEKAVKNPLKNPLINNRDYLLWQDPNLSHPKQVATLNVTSEFENICKRALDGVNPVSDEDLAHGHNENEFVQHFMEKSGADGDFAASAFSIHGNVPESNFRTFPCVLGNEPIPAEMFAGRIQDPSKGRGFSGSKKNPMKDFSGEEKAQQNNTQFRWASYFKPFGTLCYVLREPRENVKKMEDKFQRAVFLGFSGINSSWLFGIWREDKTVKAEDGLKFRVVESRNAKFTGIKVSNLEHLKHKNDIWLNTVPTGENSIQVSGLSPVAGELQVKTREHHLGNSSKHFPDWNPYEAQDGGQLGADTSVNRGTETVPNPDSTGELTVGQTDSPVPNTSHYLRPESQCKDSVLSDKNVSSKKRGRPVGSKDVNKRVRRSPDELMKINPDTRAVKCSAVICACSNVCAEDEDDSDAQEQVHCDSWSPSYLSYKVAYSGDFRDHCVDQQISPIDLQSISIENDAEAKDCIVNLSIRKALASAESVSWKKAIDNEYDKLIRANTWREPTAAELRSGMQQLPVGILLSKKRSGAHKCRAVALGNLLHKESQDDVFAPTLSMTAHRVLLVKAARAGDYIKCFDIDSAFLNANINIDILIKLPPDFVKPGETRVKKLLKALYGLPQAPKAWFQHYAKGLKILGWEQCLNEASLYRKKSRAGDGQFLKLSVYVDDNFITGPDLLELEEEIRLILAQYAGREIKAEVQGNWQKWDVLGAEFEYNRRAKTMKLSMASYIEKMAEKFDIRNGAKNPNFPEDAILSDKNEIIYGYREIIGSLQWVATIARPDVARNINLLSRYLGKPPTMQRVNAAKTIIKYLLTTKNEGISYSPMNEMLIKNRYKNDGDDEAVPKSEHLLFNDASFASHVDSFYSNSGSVLFIHGTPVAWRSGRQKIRAQSTCEAEWIAASDGLSWVQQISCLEFFEGAAGNLDTTLPADLLIMCDNKSAVRVAKTEEVKPKSRHYALRLFRVRDEGKRVIFCRTHLMAADALTKAVPGKQRALLLGGSARLPP